MKKTLLLLFFFTLLTIIAWSQSTIRMATATGTATYVATFNPPLTSLNSQTMYTVTFSTENGSTAVTLDPDGVVPATDIKQNDGTSLGIGDIATGGTYNLKYDPASGDFKIIGGTGSGGGGVSTNIYNSDGELTSNRILDGEGFNLTMEDIVNYNLVSTGYIGMQSGDGGIAITSNGDITLATASGSSNIIAETIEFQAEVGSINLLSDLGSVSLTSTVQDIQVIAGDDIDLNPADDILLKGIAASSPTTQFFRGDGTWAVVGPGTPDLTWVTKTANYTPIATDSSLVQPAFNMRSASAISFTVPPFSTTNFQVGQSFLIYADSTGQVSLLEGVGVNFETTAESGTGPWTLDEDEYAVVTKSNATNTWKLMMGTGGGSGGDNIYNIDGSLTAGRTLTGAGFDLTFTGVDDLFLESTSFTGQAQDNIDFFTWDGNITFEANEATTGNVTMIAGNSVSLVSDDVDFDILDDLQLNGVSGTTGQVIGNTSGHAAWVTLSSSFTNTAAANEMAKSDGTNLVTSGLSSTTAGNLTFGLSSTSGSTRTLAAAGSATNIDMVLQTKGTSSLIVDNPVNIYFQDANSVFIQGSTSPSLFIGANGTSGSGYVKPGEGTVGQPNGMTLEFVGGIAYQASGNGSGGNMALVSGARRSAGSGTDGKIYINALGGWTEWINGNTTPTGLSNAVGVYSQDVSSSAEWFVKNELGYVHQISGYHWKKLTYDLTSTPNSGSTETQLFNYSLPANTLAVNGQAIHIRVAGSTALNGNTKTLRMKFGAVTFMTTNLGGNSINNIWGVDCYITRNTATTQKCNCMFNNTDGYAITNVSTAGETMSGAITLLVTGQGTASSDILRDQVSVFYEP